MTKFTRGGIAVLALILIALAGVYAFAAVHNGWKVTAYTPSPMETITIKDSKGNVVGPIELSAAQLLSIWPIPIGQPLSRYVDLGDMDGDNNVDEPGDYVTNRGTHPTQ